MFTFEDGTEYDGPFDKDRMINRKIGQQIIAPESPSKSPGKKEPLKVNDSATASKIAPKEVEQNPFKKLIDISDLMDFEANPVECEKEC